MKVYRVSAYVHVLVNAEDEQQAQDLVHEAILTQAIPMREFEYEVDEMSAEPADVAGLFVS